MSTERLTTTQLWALYRRLHSTHPSHPTHQTQLLDILTKITGHLLADEIEAEEFTKLLSEAEITAFEDMSKF